MTHCMKLYDKVRIDHFRGFDEYFSIPYGAENAIGGHWEKGPGIDLFRKVEQALGWKQVIAEDLGYVTDSVRQLVHDSGFPGMKVLEFAFDSRDTGSASDYLPHNYSVNSVAYTGTHDNETIVGYFRDKTDYELAYLYEYLNIKYKEEIPDALIRAAYASIADVVIIQMQDLMKLGNEARMNAPSTVGRNCRWRIGTDELSEERRAWIRTLATVYHT